MFADLRSGRNASFAVRLRCKLAPCEDVCRGQVLHHSRKSVVCDHNDTLGPELWAFQRLCAQIAQLDKQQHNQATPWAILSTVCS